MAKERKTKSQKIAAESRHFVYHFEEISPTKTPSIKPRSQYIPENHSANFGTTTLKADTIKTGSLVFLIVIAEFLLLTILKNNLLNVPGLTY